MKNRILAVTGFIFLIAGFTLRTVYQTSKTWYSIPKNPEHVIVYPAALVFHPIEGVRNFILIIFILILVILFLIALRARDRG